MSTTIIAPIRTSEPSGENLPKGWRWVKLQHVARLESGHTPSRREPRYWGGDVPWLSLKDVRVLNSRYIYDTADHPTPLGIENSSARILPKGTVAFCRTASVGKTVILGRAMATSQDFANWVCGPELDPEYLFEALQASSVEFDKEKQGTTHKTIYMPVLEQFHVLLPPMPMQKHIASVLEAAHGIRRKRKLAMVLTEKLLRAKFIDMFGDPGSALTEWKVAPLAELTLDIEAGWSANGEPRPARDAEYGVLKISAVTSGRFLAEENKAVQEAAVQSRSLLTPRRGDLLFSRANTRELIAACCLVEQDHPRLFLPDKLWRIVPNQSVARVEYLKYILADPTIRGRIAQQATGTSGSMLNISMEKLRRLEIPVPPIELQDRFANYLWIAYAMRERQELADRSTEDLLASIGHRAFHGDLPPPHLPSPR
ncbi:restriction endonuclease subunit S [Sorangium sp. So ce315]|uniref:restriction endonuclease subunit S n=1 Tax=Sorangium sp. So ce315 TaxID=3133299 RepID=UPI003F613B36